MRVLVACERSGAVRRALRALGADAWSWDLVPADDGDPHHLHGDVRRWLRDPWDGLLAFPDCTYPCSSGLHWNKRRPERAALTEDALAFARLLGDGPEVQHIPRRVLENPIGCLSTRWRKPDQIVQPWQFGDDASKATCLWLHGVDPLVPTNVLPGGRQARRANQTASGQNKLGPSADRAKLRAVTYPGIAHALAAQMVAAFFAQ